MYKEQRKLPQRTWGAMPLVTTLVFLAIFGLWDQMWGDVDVETHSHPLKRILSLCLTCGQNLTFLEDGETMTPTAHGVPTPPPVVVPDSQLGLPFPSPSELPNAFGLGNLTDSNTTISLPLSMAPSLTPAALSKTRTPTNRYKGWTWFRNRTNTLRPRGQNNPIGRSTLP
jgi:hypothetical protein